jgi:predicted flavoprotein YhiN
MGFKVDWSNHMTPHIGKPMKAIRLTAGATYSRGEIVISAAGIEGGGIYAVSKALREGAPLVCDLMPDWDVDRIRNALKKPQGKNSLSNHIRKTLKLDSTQIAILSEFGRPFPPDIPPLIKALPITLNGPQAMDQAISTAGGIRFDAMQGFRLRNRPHVFCAGEMLDWEAATGGYLLTGCLATGRSAALQAINEPAL